MKSRPIVQRSLAHRDIEEALQHYLDVDAAGVAVRFVDALEAAYAHIAKHPGTGSPRYAHELNLPGLRSWPMSKYPYLIFYMERSEHIDVWRVLHMHRDIPAWMGED